MPIDIVSISHIKYQNCVWNCLVAWSMWKKESKYCLAPRNDDCLDLSASYFVFPHIWENQSFFTTSYRGRGETKRPFVLLYDICAMTKQHSEKNLNQTHSSSSEASAWLTQKEKIFFPELWSTWRSRMSCQKSTTFPTCSMFVCLSNWFHCVDEKQTKGVIDSTLSQVFEGQVTKPSVKIQHILASKQVTFLLHITEELYETYHHIRLGRGFQDDSWTSRPFQHCTST